MPIGSPQNHQTTPPPSQEYSRLLDAPIEILERILAHLASPSDLLSLACTSRTCASLVIPHHIEYRHIRTETYAPHVWAHLVRRVDRARNIREVGLWERRTQKRVPKALFNQDELDLAAEALHVAYYGGKEQLPHALANMEELEVFRWNRDPEPKYSRPPGQTISVKDESEEIKAVFKALKRLKNLKTLDLSGTFHLHSTEGVGTGTDRAHPLYELSHIESLRLDDKSWALHFANRHFVNFFSINRITTLNIYFDVGFFTERSIILPHLKTLVVLPGALPSDYLEYRTKFMEAHPGIEDLTCNHSGFSQASTTNQLTLLPSLRRLKANHTFMIALFAKAEPFFTRTKLEEVFIKYLNDETLRALECAKVTKLRKLVVGSVINGIKLWRIARAFGGSLEILSIRLLSSKHWETGQPAVMDWIKGIPNLQVLQLEAEDLRSTFDLEETDLDTRYSSVPRPVFLPQDEHQYHPIYSTFLAQNPKLRQIRLELPDVVGTSVIELGSCAGDCDCVSASASAGECARRGRGKSDVYISYVASRRGLW